jgi:hypothetical protein
MDKPTSEIGVRLRAKLLILTATRIPSQDVNYGETFLERARSSSIKDHRTAPRPPFQAPYIKRGVGAILRRRLYHVIVRATPVQLIQEAPGLLSQLAQSSVFRQIPADYPGDTATRDPQALSPSKRWADYTTYTFDSDLSGRHYTTDQGSPFTSKEFPEVLKDTDIQISMDGKSR